MADSIASPVRVRSFYEDEDIYTRKRTFTSVHAKRKKKKNDFFHRKDSKWTLYCGFFTTSDRCSVVHLVINNGYCGKTSKGLLRYIQGENGTLLSWKSTYLTISLIVYILTSFTKAFQLSLFSKLSKSLYIFPKCLSTSLKTFQIVCIAEYQFYNTEPLASPTPSQEPSHFYYLAKSKINGSRD